MEAGRTGKEDDHMTTTDYRCEDCGAWTCAEEDEVFEMDINFRPRLCVACRRVS